MKIAILSDTHNRTERVVAALAAARDKGASLVIHCGDIEGTEVVGLFAGWDAHFVFGNCDHDRDGLRRAMAGAAVTLHEGYGHLEVEGKKLAFLHGHIDGQFEDVVGSGAYDYLFHGHTHAARDKMFGATRVINPGALHRAARKTFVVLTLPSGEAETVEVE